MKVKDIVKRYSATSTGSLVVMVTGDTGALGKHTFSNNGLNDLLERDAPILHRTVGMIMQKDGELIIYAQ